MYSASHVSLELSSKMRKNDTSIKALEPHFQKRQMNSHLGLQKNRINSDYSPVASYPHSPQYISIYIYRGSGGLPDTGGARIIRAKRKKEPKKEKFAPNGAA